MAKDRIVELTLVVRLDRHLDEDLETILRELIGSDGTIEVAELTRIGMTGTIDLPHVWLPSSGGSIYDANLDPNAKSLPPPPKKSPPPVPDKWTPPWRKKR